MDSREWRGRWRRRRWRSERARQRRSPPRRLRRRGADAGPAGGAEARLEHRPKLEARLGLPRFAMRGRSRQPRSPGASRRRGHPALHEAGVSAEGPDLPAGRGPPLAARLGPGVGETRRRARADCSPPGTRSACSRSCRRGYGTQAEHLTPLQGRGRLRNLNEHGAFAATARHRLSLIRKGSQVRVRASALRKCLQFRCCRLAARSRATRTRSRNMSGRQKCVVDAAAALSESMELRSTRETCICEQPIRRLISRWWYELAEHRQALASRWAELPQLERQVVGLRLVHGLTRRHRARRAASIDGLTRSTIHLDGARMVRRWS